MGATSTASHSTACAAHAHGSVMTDATVHVRDYDIRILMCANTNPHMRNTDARICAQVMTMNERRTTRINALDEQARLCAQCVARVSISRQCRGCSSISSIHVESRELADNLIPVRRQATLPHCGKPLRSPEKLRSPKKNISVDLTDRPS